MGEFHDMANQIASEIYENVAQKGKGISAAEVTKIVLRYSEHFGPTNCYPGVGGASCYKIAVFVSLRAKVHVGQRRKKGHLGFSKALTEIVRHMQGRCPDETYHVVLITDDWNADIYNDWKANFEQIKKNASVEMYLMNNKSCNPIKT